MDLFCVYTALSHQKDDQDDNATYQMSLVAY